MKSLPVERMQEVLERFLFAVETERIAQCNESEVDTRAVSAWRECAHAWHRAFEYSFSMLALELLWEHAKRIEEEGKRDGSG